MLADTPPLTLSRTETNDTETDIFVVSEDEPGQWRVADRANDVVFGPYDVEVSALRVAFEGVRRSRRWEIHIVDQFGAQLGSYNSDQDVVHVKVE